MVAGAALAAAAAALPPAVQAQQAEAEAEVQLAQLDNERTFDIPAQPLTSALARFGQQSGLQITVDGALVRDVSAPALQGRMTNAEALRRLLAGSGLTYSVLDDTTISIRRPGPSQSDGPTMLDPITVTASGLAPPQAEIGNLPPAYAGGQVARGGKLGILGNRDMMDTPFSQTVYTQQTIEDQQATTLADVLDNDPSVRANFPAGSGIDQANIRGFVAGNQDVAFGGLYGIAPTSNGMMAVESIERVEVLKGPNALLNGMAPFGTTGGAINIVPKRAGPEPLTQVTPSYQSDGQLGGHVDLARRFGKDDRFGVRINGLYRDGNTALDQQSQQTGLATVGLDLQQETVRFSADLGYQLQDTDATRRPVAFASALDVPDAPDGDVNYGQSWSFTENENYYSALRGEFDILENLTAFAAVGGSIRYGRSISVNPTVLDDSGTIAAGNATALRNLEEAATFEAGLRGSFTTGFVRHDATVASTHFWKDTGLAFANTAIGASNLYDPVDLGKPDFPDLPDADDVPLQSRQKLTSYALTDTLSVLDDRVQLTLGLRRQAIETKNYNTTTGALTSRYNERVTSPAVGVVVRPFEELSLYGNYIQGLSPGAIAPITATNVGEVLPPFETEQFEVGVKLDLDSLAITLAAFQIAQPSAYTQDGVFGEFGEQRHRGLELTAFGEPLEGFRLLGGATYIDSELTETLDGINRGNEGVAVPDFQANVGAEWDLPFLEGFTLSGRVVYTSSQYLNAANTQEIPSWTRVDLGARYTLDVRGTPIVIRANMVNLFDEDYWASAATTSGRAGPGEPRTFLLSTSFAF